MNELSATPDAAGRFAQIILEFIGEIPSSSQGLSPHPAQAARERANRAAASAALAAGTLSLPPGPIGWLTLIPEMTAVWRIQTQMVADIAALYGKQHALTREQMLYCLFKHSAAQAVRDLIVRAGERALVRRASRAMLERLGRRIGLKLTQRGIGKGLSRWLPIVGAVGVGAYAYFDTAQVASTAIELFESDIEVEPEPGPGPQSQSEPR